MVAILARGRRMTALSIITFVTGLAAACVYRATRYLRHEGWPRPAWMDKAFGPLLALFCALAAWWVFLRLVGH